MCRGSITRKKFEELCNDLWERSLNPLKQVLTDAGITQQQLHSVELIGGGTRVPKLKVLNLAPCSYCFVYNLLISCNCLWYAAPVVCFNR